MDSPAPLRIAALYCFAPIADPAAVRPALLDLCTTHDVQGTLLLATEGVNGTIAGPAAGVAAVVAAVEALVAPAVPETKYADAAVMPFGRMKVRLKREIVTMGIPGIDPTHIVGSYVAPADWNALIADPDTLLIDTRNAYEVAIGTFAGAIDPGTRSFSEFPGWWRDNRDRLLPDGAPRKVAMFCTGGIRCEKATAFLKEEGVEQVYHLHGGILRYLEDVPASDSRWQGECYVFDGRVAVGHGLQPGGHALCPACGMPVDGDGRSVMSPGDCPHCHGTDAPA